MNLLHSINNIASSSPKPKTMLTKSLLSLFCLLFVHHLANAQPGNPAKPGVSRFDVKMTAAQSAAIPTVAAGMPILPGTTWAVISIYEKGTVPKTQFRPGNFLFCKSGKWEHQTGTLFLGGTYKAKGAVLTTTDDGAAAKPQGWKLRWDGSVKEMEMEQANLIFVLRYQGTTTC